MELRTVAIIDDDATTRKVLQWVLERHGYAVVAVADADEAVSLCREPKLAVTALIADVRLRTQDTGIDIALAVQREYPDLPILITSGTPPEGWTQKDFANFKTLIAGQADFLAKPFTAGTLVEKLKGLLSGAGIPAARQMYNSAELHRSGLTAAALKKL